jgi:hypothetical protein
MINSGEFDVKQLDQTRRTIAHFAVREGHQEIVKYLVGEVGVDLNIKNDYGRNVLELAIMYCRGKIARWLVEKGGADLKSINKSKYSDLQIAMICGNLDKVKGLIRAGADLHEHKDGYQPIHWAAKAGWIDIVKYLINHCGVDVNCENNSRWSPLYYAAYSDHLEIVKWLVLVAGADEHIKDMFLTTALTIAKGNSRIWLLQRAGCDMGLGTSLACYVFRDMIEEKGDKKQYLDLAGLNIGNSACKLVGLALQDKYFKVTHINLSNNMRIGKEGIDALVEALPRSRYLEELELSDLSSRSLNKLRCAGQAKNIKIICEFPSLFSIVLDSISDSLSVPVNPRNTAEPSRRMKTSQGLLNYA